MNNPFEEIQKELQSLKDVVELSVKQIEEFKKQPKPFIPINEIIGTYCERSAFYKHVQDGTFKLYKLGKLSFVKSDEFFASFVPVELTA